jgi:hypothetical protein
MAAEGQVVALARAAIEGRVDAVTEDAIYGWAWDRRDRGRRLEIEIRLGERLLGRCPADRERADLAGNGIGDGRHAFEFALTEPVPAARQSELQVLAIPPDGEPVALAMPTPGELAAENVLAPPLGRMADAIDMLAGAYRQSAGAQRNALKALQEQIETASDRADARATAEADAREKTAAALTALEKRMGELEVFAVRFDESLRTIDRRLAARPEAADRPLRRLVGGLGLVTALAVGLAVYAVLGGRP